MDLVLLLGVNQNPVIFLHVLFSTGNCTTTSNTSSVASKNLMIFLCSISTTVLFFAYVYVWREKGTAPVQVVLHVRAFSSFRYFPPILFILNSPANFLVMQQVYLYFYLTFSPPILSLNNPSLPCCTRSPLLR